MTSTGSPPVVSVCIANYNGAHMLEECIGSVLAQVGSPEFEIIVHDDASTDLSLEVLNERFPDVRVIRSDQNVGFCIANNRMVAAACGTYVLLLNNDASLFPDALATLFEASASSDGVPILSLPQYDRESGDLVDRGCLLDPMHTPAPNLDSHRQQVAYAIGACLWVPRLVWNQLRGFPEWMESIAEDMYLCCAARVAGHDVRIAHDSGYFHRQGASFGGNRMISGPPETTYRRRYLSERNRVWVLLSCLPGPFVWPWLAAHLLVMLTEGIIVSALTRDFRALSRIYAPAIWHALSRGGPALGARRLVQAGRQIGLIRYLSGFTPSFRKLQVAASRGLPRFR